jgi:hypothetical protein
MDQNRNTASHQQCATQERSDYLSYSPPSLLDRLIEGAQKIHKGRLITSDTNPRYTTQVWGLTEDGCRISITYTSSLNLNCSTVRQLLDANEGP